MQGLRIFFLAVAAAIVYGILHDLITTRVCLEYFTIAHSPIFGGTQDPTLLALGWGVIATWWVGAIIGIPFALAARVGGLPKMSAWQLLQPIGVLLLCMALCAAITGLTGWILYARGSFALDWPEIPTAHRAAFTADMFTHLASYAAGACGGMVLMVWVLAIRWRRQTALHRNAA